MKRFDKYVIAFRLGIQNSMEYRTDFFLSIVSIIFPITLNIFYWTAVFSNGSGNIVFGYTYNQIITYTVLSGVVSTFVSAGFAQEMAGDIKGGGLNKYLVQPIIYFHYMICRFFGGKLVQSGVLIVIMSLLVFVFKDVLGLGIGYEKLLVFLAALVLATVLNFAIFFCVGVTAFWVSEVSYLFWAISVLVNLAGGGVFPIEIFGPAVYKILNLLPFKYTIYFPINVLNDKLSMEHAVHGLLIQILWICILVAAANLFWNKGVRKYIAIGG